MIKNKWEAIGWASTMLSAVIVLVSTIIGYYAIFTGNYFFSGEQYVQVYLVAGAFASCGIATFLKAKKIAKQE